MKNLTLTICLTLAVLLGTTGASWGADYQKGVTAYNRDDFATALREFRPLAEQGDARAQFSLGSMYEKGLGLPKDYEIAVKWYTLAAEQGYALAQFLLGAMYASGKGVPQDLIYAYMWVNIAVSNGYEEGGKLRDIVAEEMTTRQLEKAEELARECVRKEYKGC